MVRWIPVACVALLPCGCSRDAARSTDGKATVVRVVDGDTIVVQINGSDETVRILGIDTSKPQKTPLRRFGRRTKPAPGEAHPSL